MTRRPKNLSRTGRDAVQIGAKKSNDSQLESLQETPAIDSATRSLRRTDLIFGVVLFAAVLAVYQPVWHGGYLWDDNAHVTKPELRSWYGLYQIWFEIGATQQYYPLLHSAFWLEYQIWGDSTLGYHLLNISLHVVAALLVAVVLRQLRIPGAYLAAAIFALHPVHVESVAWITEEKNTLSAVFYLAAASFYLRFDEMRKRWIYGAAFTLFVLGLMCKTVTATLPAALLVIFWWQRGRLSWHRDVLPLLPFFVVGAVAGVFTAWVERKLIGAEGAAFDLTVIDRCLIAGRAIWFYLSKLVWPADLMFFYPRWHVSQAVWWQYLFPAAVLALATALWAVRRRWRAPLAGFLFFAGTLFPVLGFCNVYPFIVSFVADHFQYLASLGIIVLAGTALTLGLRRMGLANRSAGYVLSMMVLMCLAFLTWRQSRMYADVVVLYKTTIQRNPDCWMAYNNLGTQLLIDGDVETAIADFKKALELRPDFSEAHNNLGLVLANHQQYDEAIAHYREALKANRFSSAAYNNLGNALLATGKFEDGVASFKKALEIDPNYAEACNNLGAALTGHQQYEEAIPYFQRALEIQPDYAEAHNNFGLALADCQRFDEAIVHYKRILKIHPNNAEAHYNFGMALSALHQLDQAIEEYDKSLKIRPDYAEAHNNLGNVLAELGKIDEAIEHYRKALEGQPENTDFLNNLGNALTRRRQHDEALACFQRAVKIKPDSVAILNNLGLAFSECGRFDEAIVSFRKILEFQPNNADTYLNLGGIRIRQGQSDAAIVEFRKAWEIKRDDARISCCLAMALASSRQLREAVAQYQATLAIDPNYLQAVQNLAWLLAVCPDESIRNGAKAVEYAKRAIQLSDGKDPSVFDTLAAAYAENGQFADAAQAAQHATELAAANGNMQLAEAIQSRLQLYQLDLPYHVSFEDAP